MSVSVEQERDCDCVELCAASPSRYRLFYPSGEHRHIAEVHSFQTGLLRNGGDFNFQIRLGGVGEGGVEKMEEGVVWDERCRNFEWELGVQVRNSNFRARQHGVLQTGIFNFQLDTQVLQQQVNVYLGRAFVYFLVGAFNPNSSNDRRVWPQSELRRAEGARRIFNGAGGRRASRNIENDFSLVVARIYFSYSSRQAETAE